MGVFGFVLTASSCSSGEPFNAGSEPSAGSGGKETSSAAGSAGGPVDNTPQGGMPDSASGGGGADAGAGGASGEPPMLECPAGKGDCNADPADGCEATLDNASHCGSCKACSGATTPDCTEQGGTYSCTNPASTLSGKRLEQPCFEQLGTAALCGSQTNPTQCKAMGGNVAVRAFTMGGEPGKTYDVSLRIRGVVEPRIYLGGKDVGDHFYVGGMPQTPSGYNAYSIAVSAPAKTYYLNSADSQGELYKIYALDSTQVIPISAGANVTLQVSDSDCAMVKNCQSFEGDCAPNVVKDVAPADGFKGQFVQVDVVKVAPQK
jgi:hypothetical protein